MGILKYWQDWKAIPERTVVQLHYINVYFLVLAKKAPTIR